MIDLPSEILHSFTTILGDKPLPLHQPIFSGNEIKYLTDCIETTFVSSVGKYVTEFELSLANFIGCKRVVATSSGTSALEISLKLAGVCPNDEVLLSPLTFVATANAVSYIGATPHFVDCEDTTFGIDPHALLEWLNHMSVLENGQCVNKFTNRRIKALVPTHVFGLPCQIVELAKICLDYNLVLVEDSAESLGSSYSGLHTGLFGLLGAISFNGNKIITTGGGGAIITNDNALADRAKHLTTTAKVPHSWNYWHDEIGYNYRMPNLNAAVGLAQLESIDQILLNKRKLQSSYSSVFNNLPLNEYLGLVSEPKNSVSNYWLNTLILKNKYIPIRDEILKITNQHGYGTRPVWSLLNRLPMYKSNPHSPLPTAEILEMSLINIPSNPINTIL